MRFFDEEEQQERKWDGTYVELPRDCSKIRKHIY